MNYQLVTYRTTDHRFNQHAVVPDLYVSDLLTWLKLSEHATIIRVTDNRNATRMVVPDNWPSYSDCEDYVRISDIVDMVALGR